MNGYTHFQIGNFSNLQIGFLFTANCATERRISRRYPEVSFALLPGVPLAPRLKTCPE
jgi:hypothetical protein